MNRRLVALGTALFAVGCGSALMGPGDDESGPELTVKDDKCDTLCNAAKGFKKAGSDFLYVHCHACKGDKQCNKDGTVVCHDDNVPNGKPGHNLCYDSKGEVFDCSKFDDDRNGTVDPIEIPNDQSPSCIGKDGVGQQALVDPDLDFSKNQGCDLTRARWECKEYSCDAFKKDGKIKICDCIYREVKCEQPVQPMDEQSSERAAAQACIPGDAGSPPPDSGDAGTPPASDGGNGHEGGVR